MKRALVASALLTSIAASPALALDDDFASNAINTAVWLKRLPLTGSKALSGRDDELGLDGEVARLVYPANGPTWQWGPRYATQISSRATALYGAYEARMRSGRAARLDGVISALFTYANDGGDWDGDGLIDNHEIDIELSNTERSVLYLTVWTEYDDSTGVERFHRIARRIDLATGEVWGTPVGGESDWDLVAYPSLPFADASFDHGAQYYTYGFDWEETSVAFWIDLEDGEGPRALWTLNGNPGDEIPSLPSPLFLNVWHNPVNWWTRATAPPATRNAVFRIDYVHGP
ncbi:MAG: glycoside hydrolase family 16 protein [Dehalococcoidia bacterium]|nr:glycoside hydrolase family 16 protein [Dehalococcoidia bacterium]MCB9506579.1 glycoside hydrolase family 16 protein [Myxococcales bacterium]